MDTCLQGNFFFPGVTGILHYGEKRTPDVYQYGSCWPYDRLNIVE